MARSRDRQKALYILESAFSVFGETGYEATAIKRIADRAGIAPGTIYTYFRSKEDLFRCTVEEGWRRFLSRIESLLDSPQPPEQRLESLLEIGFQTLKSSIPLLRGMLFESSQMNLLAGNLDRLCALAEQLLAGRERGPAAGDPVQRRARIRLTIVGVLFSAALAAPDRVDQEIEALRRTVAGLAAGGG